MGLVYAAANDKELGEPSFYSTTFAVGFLSFLLLHYLRTALLLPPSEGELDQPDPARLTDSITSAIRSSYAISSNWLYLWRSSTFRHYLHLDAAASLIAYSFRYDSSLLRFSRDEGDLKEFFQSGLDLLDEIASGQIPVQKHRLRLLIYPGWVYTDFRSDIEQLIRSHSAARIPCIPVVADQLFSLLNEDERHALRKLTDQLEQSILDKGPPRPPVVSWLIRQRLRFGLRVRDEWKVVFPDMLLVDAGVAHDTSAMWWYSSNGDINSRRYNDSSKQYVQAQAVFRSICKHAPHALWADYAPEKLGGVTIAASSGRLESEAFFAREHYNVWLRWILDHKRSNPHARELDRWLRGERILMAQFVNDQMSHSNPNDVLAPQRSLRLLDIGCGTGGDILKLLKDNENLHAVGVDIIERNVSEGWQRVHQAKLTDRAALFVADAASLSEFGEDEFDMAICMTNTLGNLPPEKQEELARRLRVILKPNGHALISVYSEASVATRLASYEAIGLHVEQRTDHILASEGLRSHHFTAAQLRRLLEENGLEVCGDVQHIASIGLAVIARCMPE